MKLFSAVPSILAFCMVTSALPARAALISDVADAADGDDPFDLNLDFRWSRRGHAGRITREYFDTVTSKSIKATELQYARTTHTLDMSIEIGLYHDLSLRGNMPYVVYDRQNWEWGSVDGVSVESTSTITNNTLNADGACITTGCTPQPLFAVPGNVDRGGFLDPSVGIAWAIFNGEREERLPDALFPHKIRTATWVLGFDYTMPIADAMNPSKVNPASPETGGPFPMGVGAHRFTWWMSMSKRLGIIDPYLRLHYTLPVTSEAAAYDNCNQAGKDTGFLIMNSWGQTACDKSNPDAFWKGKTGLELPHRGGLVVGAEFIPIEEKDDSLRLAIGVQLSADYVSKGRGYSELADALKRLTYTEDYMAIDSRLFFDLRFSKWVHFTTALGIGSDTPHQLTTESVGKDRHGPPGGVDTNGDGIPDPDGLVDLNSNERNPNFDVRVDQAGRRFEITGVMNTWVSTNLSINF